MQLARHPRAPLPLDAVRGGEKGRRETIVNRLRLTNETTTVVAKPSHIELGLHVNSVQRIPSKTPAQAYCSHRRSWRHASLHVTKIGTSI